MKILGLNSLHIRSFFLVALIILVMKDGSKVR